MSDEEFSATAVEMAFCCDCLGCIMEAHETGVVNDDEYQAIFDLQQEIDQQKAKCPKCGGTAYVSLYEPDVMHCPECGLYSHRETGSDPWKPLRQGAIIEESKL